MKGSKISDDKIAAILVLHKQGLTGWQIAMQVGVSEESVSNYIKADELKKRQAEHDALVRDLSTRIELTRVTLNKKAEFYHFVTMHGNERQRRDALCDIATLRAELKELEKRKEHLMGGGGSNAKNQC